MIQIRYPKRIKARDDLILIGIKLKNLKNKTRLTFLWGDDSIKVLGANMISPNVFEFAPTRKEDLWYLKYSASQDAKPSAKRLYVSVEKIKSRKIIIWVMRIISLLFVILPIIFFYQVFEFSSLEFLLFDISIGSISVSLPVMSILSVFLWSRRVTEYVNRIFSISEKAAETEIEEYSGKGMSNNPIKIIEQNNNENAENNDDNFSSWISIKPQWRESEINDNYRVIEENNNS